MIMNGYHKKQETKERPASDQITSDLRYFVEQRKGNSPKETGKVTAEKS